MKKIFSLLSLLLILNVITHAQSRSLKINEEMMAQQIIEGLTKTINLTPSQAQQLKPMYVGFIQKQNAILDNKTINDTQKKQQMAVLAIDANKKLMSVLTPEQQAKIKAIGNVAKERIKAAKEKYKASKN